MIYSFAYDGFQNQVHTARLDVGDIFERLFMSDLFILYIVCHNICTFTHFAHANVNNKSLYISVLDVFSFVCFCNFCL